MTASTARRYRIVLGFLIVTAAPVALRLPAQAQTQEVSKIAGAWTWTWKDRVGNTHRHVMEVEGTGTKLAAREIFDEQLPVRVTNLTLDGAAIKFTVVRGETKSEYKGKVADKDHMNGKVLVSTGGEATEFVWKAERRKEVPK